MPEVIVAGGGLAGLAASAALSSDGHRVRILESRPFLGGRATSWEFGGEIVDNCQHILLRCCTNLLDFYERLGVRDSIAFHREFYFLEPGGRTSTLRPAALPGSLRLAPSFLGLKFLGLGDKIAVLRGLRVISKGGDAARLAGVSMLDWLHEQCQPSQAIERFWRPILVSAVNEELDRMAATHGFQVFKTGMLGAADAYEMGVPAVPLGELYRSELWQELGNVELLFRSPVERFVVEDGRVQGVLVKGEKLVADQYICALPFDKVATVLPELNLDLSGFEHSPITGIHLWFDRPVTTLPHAALLDRTIQWMFNKSGGRYLQLVVSASRSLIEMGRGEVIQLAVQELGEFFPAVKQATLEKATVIKEAHATFSALPGLDAKRPVARTAIPNLFLAGDWTRTSWPATMEGAVRSGYLAAEALSGRRFLRD